MSEFSFDVGDADFDVQVLATSQQVPVLVDFWAPWCQPCRVLKPLLEKLTAEYGGQFRLAKINSDENPESSRRWGVRGIPAVKAFVGGQLVDEFTGALPEGQVRAFIERLMPSRAIPLLEAAAKALAAGDVNVAASLLGDAEALLRDAAERTQFDSLQVRLALARNDNGSGDLAALLAAVKAYPDDLAPRLQLANAQALVGEYREAGENLLSIVQQDRKWQDEAGRKGLLNLFTLLGSDATHAELLREFRARLARLLN
jgi:putative thioredoxin